MKIKSMPRMSAALLCVFAIFGGMMMPASAVSPAEDYGALVRYEGESISIEPTADAIKLDEADEGQNDVKGTPRLLEGVLVRQITGYPLVYCEEDNAIYYFENLYANQVWGSTSQSQSLHLTTTQKDALYSNVFNAIAGLNDGKTYGIMGWRLVGRVELVANRPHNVKWIPSSTCLDGTEERTVNVVYNTSTLTIDEMFGLPVNHTEYYNVGCDGAFYRYYPNGTLGGTMMGVGISVNTSN